MSNLPIGKYTAGGIARLNLESFLETRGLLQANSGGGKSYTLRRIIEVLADRVQQVIIDTEGEFASLREKFNFVIVAAAGGDAIAHPKTAALLARRLLETRVSAILDISELKAKQRDEFVRNFIEGLMELPRELWGELLVILDEAHAYCPEKGQGEALATDAVIDLASRGRKRGFCLLAATQRSSKFHKSAAAELLNKFVGRTGLDVDVKRAAFDLGMTPKDAQASLSNLDAGQFYVFGPAISKTVALMMCDQVETTHPKSGHRGGKRALQLPKPTDAIRAVLPQLADLQEEQERKAKTEEELRRELSQAQRDLATLKRQPAVQAGHTAEDLDKANAQGYRDGFAAGVDRSAADGMGVHTAYADKVEAWLLKFPHADKTPLPGMPRYTVHPPGPKSPATERAIGKMVQTVAAKVVPPSRVEPTQGLTGPQQRILDALAWMEHKGLGVMSKEAVAVMADASPSSSSYGNNLGALRNQHALIHYPTAGTIELTDAGRAAARPPVDDGRTLYDAWIGLSALSEPQRRILRALYESHPDPLSKEDIAATTDASVSSSSFGNNLGRLRSLGAIDYPKPGQAALTKYVMP